MSEPLRLVIGPTADEEIRAEVVKLLEEALAEARRGEITEIFNDLEASRH